MQETKQHEGTKYIAYLDHKKIKHIGVGLNLERINIERTCKDFGLNLDELKDEDCEEGLSPELVEALYLYDYLTARREAVIVFHYTKPDEILNVLTDMVFNMGK